MATGDPVFVGVSRNVLVPQEGASFPESEYGFDEGVRKFLTHPLTDRRRYPQRGDRDSEHRNMIVTDVVPVTLESTLVEITVHYRGVRTSPTGKLDKILADSDSQMFTLPALKNGRKATYVTPVPIPAITRMYVATQKPDYNGCGLPATGDFLIAPPAFALTFVPDPDEALTLNYYTGWILQSRAWEDILRKVWLVTERYAFFYSLAV